MKIHHIDEELSVRFSDHPIPYALSPRYCTNPECDCYELLFHFQEMTGDDPHKFNLRVDLHSWKELHVPKREEKVDRWAREFLSELPYKEKSRFFNQYDAKFKAKRLQSVSLRPDDVRSGTLVSYIDIICEGRSIAEGGHSCFSVFYNNGTEYAVDPLYCPNPECHCHESHMLFVRITHDEEAGMTKLEDCMVVRLPFRGDWVVEDYWEISEPEAKRVISTWLQENPGVIGELKLQYQAIKEAGRRSFEQERHEKGAKRNLAHLTKVGKKKPGRNDPCPCGSGKKYKKCCGP